MGSERRVVVADKSCRVCRAKASCFNFGVVTCESCKSFFRRWGKTGQTFTCAYSIPCTITVSTRRSCKKCRMDKCLLVGLVHPLATYTVSSTGKCVFRKRDSIGESECSPANTPDGSMTSTGITPMDWNPDFVEDKSQIHLESARLWQHNAVDDELLHCEQWLKYPRVPPPCFKMDGDGVAWFVHCDLTNMMKAVEHLIRMMVDAGQQIDAFRNLSHNDQLALYRANTTTMIVLNTRWEKNTFLPFASAGNKLILPHKVFNGLHSVNDLPEMNKKFHSTFDPVMLNDWRLMFLLLAITLFETPLNATLDDNEGIERECRRFKKALHEHISRVYDDSCRSMYLFDMLMYKVQEARVAQSLYTTVYAKIPATSKPAFSMSSLLISLPDIAPRSVTRA